MEHRKIVKVEPLKIEPASKRNIIRDHVLYQARKVVADWNATGVQLSPDEQALCDAIREMDRVETDRREFVEAGR